MPRLRCHRKNLPFAVKCLQSLSYISVKIHPFKNYVGSTKNSHNSIYHVIFLLMFEFVWASDNISCEYFKMLGKKRCNCLNAQKEKRKRTKKNISSPSSGIPFPKKLCLFLLLLSLPTKTQSLLHFLGYKTFWRKSSHKSHHNENTKLLVNLLRKQFFVQCFLHKSERK